jgi:hypothetical protein
MERGIFTAGRGTSFPFLNVLIINGLWWHRFCYMDYLILMVILATALTSFLISYDIACIWSKGFAARVASYDSTLRLPTAINLAFAVPKFHLPVHIRSCWSEFSFNYRNYAARTDGEGIERVWSWLNRIAYSVSMMTAGARWDTLDDFCSFNNWRKNKNLSA